jgi:3-phosphoshikimate 1-carboxyvinyltransferase
LFSALSATPVRVRGLGAAPTTAAPPAIAALGATTARAGDELIVHRPGLRHLSAPPAPIDCGNSGTTIRLLTGLLAGQPFASELFGDESLSRRPMARVIEPLRAMGA